MVVHYGVLKIGKNVLVSKNFFVYLLVCGFQGAKVKNEYKFGLAMTLISLWHEFVWAHSDCLKGQEIKKCSLAFLSIVSMEFFDTKSW